MQPAKPLVGMPDPSSFMKAATPAPTPPADLRPLAEAAARKHGLDPRLFEAVIQNESDWNPKITSDAGAQGLGQIMPFNDKGLGITNPFDPNQNLEGAASMLADALKANKGDIARALAAYNAGQGAVDKYGGIPPFKETEAYVKKIMAMLPQPEGLPNTVTPSISGMAFGESPESFGSAQPKLSSAAESAQAKAAQLKSAEDPHATMAPFENEEALKKMGDLLEIIPASIWAHGLSSEDQDMANTLRSNAVQFLTPGRNWDPEMAFKSLEGLRNLYGTGSHSVEEKYAEQHPNDIRGISAQESLDNPFYNALGTALIEWYNPANKGLEALNLMAKLPGMAYGAAKTIPQVAKAVAPIEATVGRVGAAVAPHAAAVKQGVAKLTGPARSLIDRFGSMRDIAGTEGEAWHAGMAAVPREARERAVETAVSPEQFGGATNREQVEAVKSMQDPTYHPQGEDIAGTHYWDRAVRPGLSEADLTARGHAVQAATMAARDEVLRVDPRNAKRLFGGVTNDKWYPQGNLWADKGSESGNFLPEPRPAGLSGGKPMGSRGRQHETVAAGEQAGETIDESYTLAKNHIANLYQKYGYSAAADQIRKLQNINDARTGQALMQEMDFKLRVDPRARKVEDMFQKPVGHQPFTSWGTGEKGYVNAERRVTALARARTEAAAYHKLGKAATPDAVAAYVSKNLAGTKEKMMRAMLKTIAPEGHIMNAHSALQLPYLRGYSIHKNAAMAIVDSLPQLQNDLAAKVGRWLEEEHQGPASAAAAIANGVIRLVDNINALARQSLVVNPIFHPAWNVSIQALSRGLPIDKLLEAWNVDLGGPQGIARASQLDPKWEALAKEWHTDAFMGGQPYHLDPQTEARLLTVPREALPLHEQIAKTGIDLSRANQKFVFQTIEHRVSTLLFQHLVEDEKMSLAGAARAVRQALGDYENMTKFERGLGKAFFFYPWLKTVMGYWARKGIKSPQWWNAPMQSAYASRQTNQEPDISNPMAFGTGKDEKGNPRYMTLPLPQRYMRDIATLGVGAATQPEGIMAPVSDLNKLIQTHENPALRVPLDLHDMAQPGYQPQRPAAWNNALFDTRANAPTQLGQFMGSMVGDYAYPGRLATTEKEEGPASAALSMLGPSIYSEPSIAKMGAEKRIDTGMPGRPGINEQIKFLRLHGRNAEADKLLHELYAMQDRLGY